MKKPVTWFLLADGARARVMTREDSHTSYKLVFSEDSSNMHARSHDLGSDRPGHGQESANSAHHAIEPRQDPHRAEEDKFIRTVASYINGEAGKNSFDRLVIYAAPHVLSMLRKELDATATKKILGEYHKDLTKVPVADLPSHFGTA
jgi:protein required for attachment to host cells